MSAPDPTAGERLWRDDRGRDHDLGHPSGWDCDGDALGPGESCPTRRPATPDAGDVEALAAVIDREAFEDDWYDDIETARATARAVLASDWLAALLDAARREGGDEAADRIAQAIERRLPPSVEARAASCIAREVQP